MAKDTLTTLSDLLKDYYEPSPAKPIISTAAIMVSAPTGYYYAGIGSRETPPGVRAYMRWLAVELAKDGMILRSGGADGADAAFEEGCDEAGGQKEIYVPWKGFNGREVKGLKNSVWLPSLLARDEAMKFHPAWHRLSDGSKKLHARNTHQVLGQYLDKYSRFVLCWTPNGKGGGGTGQAIRIAKYYAIPVFDFGNIATRRTFDEWYGRPFQLEFEKWQTSS